MSDSLINLIIFSTATILGLIIVGAIVIFFIRDATQKKHTILRNYPIIGRLRYFFETQGKYFRQYFFTGDRDEMPFNRATRSWIYKNAKNMESTVGFGSSYDLCEPGALIFVNAAFPILEEDQLPIPALSIGEGYCDQPFLAQSIINISGMSYGAISAPAVRALSLGAAKAGCWLSTGEGGLAPFHLEGKCDIIMQIGTAKYGIRDEQGKFSATRAREIAQSVKAFEIKLSQGAKPGKGGMLPACKVSPEIAAIRGIPPWQDSISPNRHHDVGNIEELLDQIAFIRELTGRPVGIKTAIGGWHFINELCDVILRRGLEYAPDFLTIDGGEGGSGAAPQALIDYAGLPITEALPRVVDALIESGLRQRIRVVAAGKLVTSAKCAWALCAGADFVNTARGFMFSLGCIQAMRCHLNTCPTGITTNNPRLQRGLVVEEKYLRVANYATNVNHEISMIAHSCGLRHARELRREHIRIVETAGKSIALNMLYPYPEIRNQRSH
ncbi:MULTISPECIES: FMN-binding glutamate synthase family protein [Nitrosomonas]|uniref:Glutamate synthase domain-containing protein 2 n=2 Tax=Nitrosomonas eutropha TaxID=916 RepID=A0ABX5M993_9PROT|nr:MULTISPECIES: FMN-binding glutamate synthase family protein [Nitrosomonas]ABI59007.1 ferredoxin-dependent glutamate synthase [Nitrosomonas eutropha C91]MXS80822.1 FMN-binding glutamate synthase family protein [Nitrosomonas sp. GH22]PXV82238.1 glutamate synthase domain-containing protein 2 [Nitrosomonas eutropha]SDW42030.1 Glutamate synthase domain-containing protein 2 [Nitrosomonas eutropha]SEJ22666.1 Glutamate synthase domain-containing protein 2 [Nitrosomonas eutropha]